ncbi:MAG: Ppx/GppA phosphatase family protein [Acidimicrobiales bacterium]
MRPEGGAVAGHAAGGAVAGHAAGGAVAGHAAGGAVAAVDCGTNSTRLLVAGPDGRPLERLARITRLGEGLSASGRMSPAAIARTIDVLTGYREVMERHGVVSARVVATSAARDAANTDDLFASIEAVTGKRPELLAGEDEARLSFLGATAELDCNGGPYLVVDIGGGSTELAVGHGPSSAGVVLAALSVDMGCVRLTEQALHGDPPSTSELKEAAAEVEERLQQSAAALPEAAELVGLAGTVSALAAMSLGLATYDAERTHHFRLTAGGVTELVEAMAGESRAKRATRPGLEPGRVDIIVAGALILKGVMEHFGVTSCLVSESDILDGLVMSQLPLAPGAFSGPGPGATCGAGPGASPGAAPNAIG